MNLYQSSIRIVGLAAALATLIAIAGCKENAMVKNYETDNNFLRVPGQPDPTLPKQNGPLLPLTKGSHWDYSIERLDAAGMSLGKVPGKLLVAGPTKIDNQDGAIVQTIVDGQSRRKMFTRCGVTVFTCSLRERRTLFRPYLPP